MFRNYLIKILLLPASFIYGLVVSVKNSMYDLSFLKSTSFSIPVISVGNLTMGGTGKSPHIEYLIRLLKEYINIATLSRGYKRKSRGFKIVQVSDKVEDVGDEPLQFKRKFKEIDVGVAESRVIGIPKMLIYNPELQTILLDDAFQHRSVKPGLNILLTEYSDLFTKDFLLPSGQLREWRSSYKRADIIVVTKSPEILLHQEREKIVSEINPHKHQSVYFSRYVYGNPYYIFNPNQQITLENKFDILLVTGIANTNYLLDYLTEMSRKVRTVDYPDHYDFTNHDVSRIKLIFENMNSDNKIIVTTEKDAMRLHQHSYYLIENKLPIFALPTSVSFLGEDQQKFNIHVKDFLLNFKV